MNSTHKVEVFQIEQVIPHGNADLLDIIPVWDYQCCSQKGTFKPGDLAAYVPPDSVVKTGRPEFSFLAKPGHSTTRIKARRLRGIWSMGLLLPAPEGSQVGDDLAEHFEVEHYEPPLKLNGSRPGQHLDSGGTAPPPSGSLNICYDLEAWRRYGKQIFTEGEPVVVTEKIHGANARYVWADGQLHCGSRKQWKQEYPKLPDLEELDAQVGDPIKAPEIYENLKGRPKTQDLWWRAIQKYPAVIVWLSAYPGYTLYGEMFGQVQDLTYGAKPGEVFLRFFDILSPFGQWMDYLHLVNQAMIPTVPQIYVGPYHANLIEEMASGKSLIPGAQNQIREGIVVRPIHERCDPRVGRAVLKLVSNEYLAR